MASGTIISRTYRDTTLGTALLSSLDELLEQKKISGALANKVMLQFDRRMHFALANRAKAALLFKAGKLHTYRYINDVWTFILDDVEFRETYSVVQVGRLKLVATAGKGIVTGSASLSIVD